MIYNIKDSDVEKYIDTVREYFSGQKRFVYIATFGCQQNDADSEKLAGMSIDMGYTVTKDPQEADLILVNTCAIREHAEMRVFGNVGALIHQKRKNPELMIILCGCMAQKEEIRNRVKNSFRSLGCAWACSAAAIMSSGRIVIP